MGSWFRQVLGILVLLGMIGAAAAYLYMDNGVRQDLMNRSTKSLGDRVEHVLFFPTFDPRDKTTARIQIGLTPVARGLTKPTDIAFLPPPIGGMVVTEQPGRVTRVDLKTGAGARWLDVEVESAGNEQGLLSIAIHPRFAENGRLFLNYTATEEGKTYSFVSEYRAPEPLKPFGETPIFVKHVIRFEQPYANHNGGCTRFGPDGMLYVGWGDGGSRGDPEGHAQNGKDWLGSILRIDVEGEASPLAYRIPEDNPLRTREDMAPETYAIGVRNPWRFSWDELDNMIVADVGQDEWEEVGYALPGENLGWNTVEGKACYGGPDCETKGLRMPFHVYGHDKGLSITGGYLSEAAVPAQLHGLYVFGDYMSGRLFALALPEEPNGKASDAADLGAWPIHPSTFGRDFSGRLYVADHMRGIVLRFDEKPK